VKTMIVAAALAGLAAAATTVATTAAAQDAITLPFDGSFEDATFAVENAIVGQGLVIDDTSHVGDMLPRTGQDVGSAETIFDAADIFAFCSAVISRQVKEADPANIRHCPYGIFFTDRGGEVTIGYRDDSDGAMQAVEDLLVSIAADAGSL